MKPQEALNTMIDKVLAYRPKRKRTNKSKRPSSLPRKASKARKNSRELTI
jgi:hypothetical protein